MGLRVVAAALLIGLATVSPAAGEDSELGKKIFAQKCAACHGADGKGNAKMAEKLKATIPDLADSVNKSDAELLKLLSDGKKPMPNFGRSLSKDELHAVLEHAKKLARGGK